MVLSTTVQPWDSPVKGLLTADADAAGGGNTGSQESSPRIASGRPLAWQTAPGNCNVGERNNTVTSALSAIVRGRLRFSRRCCEVFS